MSEQHVTFHAHGTPASKGSKTGYVVKAKATGKLRAVVKDQGSKKLGPWQRAVQRSTESALIGMDWKLDGPMGVTLQFFFQRPLKHYVGGKRHKPLRADAPRWHTSYPDADKVVRSTFDALKQGGAFTDDRQVYAHTAVKQYANHASEEGCSITVERIGGST